MGSSLLTPKVRVPDFCNIVSQGFPGQHAWTLFVTPSGCLAAGPGQDGACPSPDTPLGSLAPPCPLGRLPAFREDGPWPGPGKGQGGWWARSGLHGQRPQPAPPRDASVPPSVAAPASSRPWGCGEQLGPSGAGPGPRPRSQDPAPHQEAACGAGHSTEPLEAAPAVSSCGLSHTGLRATCAAADAGRAFLDPVPCSREPRGGALMPRPGVLWVHPPSEARGQENHRAQGRYTLLPTWAHGPCRLPHTHTCFVCLTVTWPRHLIQAAATTTPQPPDTRKPFLCPRPASHTLSAPPSRPLAEAQGCPPRFLASPLCLRPLPRPAASFTQQTLTELPPAPRLYSGS